MRNRKSFFTTLLGFDGYQERGPKPLGVLRRHLLFGLSAKACLYIYGSFLVCKVCRMTTDTTRTNILSGSPLEPLRGYARAVQVGGNLFVSGTTAMNAKGEVVSPGEPYEQTKYILSIVKTILASRGFQPSDVVRTRLFVTNIARWEDYARAHREVFEPIRPASSMVQVVKLVDPRLVVEIEVDAIKGVRDVESVSVEY